MSDLASAEEREAERPWLTRNLRVLSAVSLAQDAASELMYPLLPILLTSVLGAPAAVVGMIEGIAEGTAAVLKYFSGRISDRIGRKPAVLAGYGLAACGKVAVAAAGSWPGVLVGRVIDRTGKGIRSAPRDALLADGVPTESLGRTFGFHRAADTIGAVIGPLLGLALLRATGGDIHAALWWAVIPALISVALVLLVRETRPSLGKVAGGPQHREAAGPEPAGPEPEGTEPARPNGLPVRLRALVVLLGLFALVNVPDALLLLRLTEIGIGPAALMACYALFNLANAAIAFPAGALSDRWPRHRVYAIGLACFAAGFIGLGLANSPLVAVPLLVVYGGFAGITEGVGRAWVSSLAPTGLGGRAQGTYQAVTGAGVLIAGLWAGLAWSLGPGAGVVPLVLAGTVGAATSITLLLLGAQLEPKDSQVTGPAG